MENQSGDGKTSPFGNGMGATQGAGPSTGGNNFLENPGGNNPAGQGKDFTKTPLPAQKQGSSIGEQLSEPSTPMGPPGNFPMVGGAGGATTPESAPMGSPGGAKPFKITSG